MDAKRELTQLLFSCENLPTRFQELLVMHGYEKASDRYETLIEASELDDIVGERLNAYGVAVMEFAVEFMAKQPDR